MFKCPNCAGQLKFNIELQKLKCDHCGSMFAPDEIKGDAKKDTSEQFDDFYEGKSYRCKQCGATLVTFDDTAVTFCSYCGSQNVLEDKMVQHNNPDGIIPFKVTKEQAVAAYKKRISGFFFAPSYLKSDMVVEKLRGIYMPYGVYNLKKNGSFTNMGEKYGYRRGDYVYYKKYKINGDADVSYSGISYDLVSKYYDNFSTAIPFDVRDAVHFHPSYMAGFYADSFDVPKDKYIDVAKSIAKSDATKKLRKHREFSKYGCATPKIDLPDCTVKVGMMPTYFMSSRDKSNKNIHYAVINGQTGKVAADLPVDFKKYALVSLILSALIFLVLFNFFTLIPSTVCIFSIISSIIALWITGKQVKAINDRKAATAGEVDQFMENNLTDKGVQTKIKVKKESRFKYNYKLIIAILIPIIALFCDFVDDIYNYMAAILSLLFVILSFHDLVKEHNLMVSSPIPQLEKRGGDENA